ncbi:hypothetical protein FOZ60_000002 [Perkinsus olseni]|uniref:Uncharacterized protein n=1 Tax=Perkinsus olseni TaxID=32597 RepID=A0A7J6PPU5_PEROL|nr:hypothetical protein FOZ60_000002 [Perkinsus olseni]
MTVPREDYDGLKKYARLLEQKLRKCAEEQERLERMHSREIKHRQKLYDENLQTIRQLWCDNREWNDRRKSLQNMRREHMSALAVQSLDNRTGFEAEITDNDRSSGSPYSILEAARDVS